MELELRLLAVSFSHRFAIGEAGPEAGRGFAGSERDLELDRG